MLLKSDHSSARVEEADPMPIARAPICVDELCASTEEEHKVRRMRKRIFTFR